MKYKKVYRDPPFYYDSRRIHFINNSSIYCPVTHFFDNHFNRLHRGLTDISFTGKREHELAGNRSFRPGNPDPHGSHRFLRRTASRPGNSGSRNGIIRPDQTAGSFCHLPYHGFTDCPELFQTFRTNSQHPFLHVIGIRHHTPSKVGGRTGYRRELSRDISTVQLSAVAIVFPFNISNSPSSRSVPPFSPSV